MYSTHWIAIGTLALTFACSSKEEGCAKGAYQCVETMLQVCKDGAWTDEEDCAANTMVCHDMGSMSHCMEEGAM
jgi:hypothetical protein